eukprot:TRINITY_DN7539_c0_g1_i1.p3 TRINITY_DN7539_c0_g1~~TRINITY_DN7539_c0_g1_i1.p3  ORF type:complete len:233 (+),score=29.42 TRINITY_DN7539_c0_g1_i1:25-699(+)
MTQAPTLQNTLALIKPDAVSAGKAKDIKHLLELQGFTIIAQQYLQLTPQRASEFYEEHNEKPFFQKLVDFMSSGPIYALVLCKQNAIADWRAFMGPTNSIKAKEEAPRTLRALFGTDGTFNACHGSDSEQSAIREIRFFFPQLRLEPTQVDYTEQEQMKKFVQKQLQPTLLNGLTQLAKEKPSSDPYEAILWLANWLLNNNPNKPRIVLPHEAKPLRPEELDLE